MSLLSRATVLLRSTAVREARVRVGRARERQRFGPEAYERVDCREAGLELRRALVVLRMREVLVAQRDAVALVQRRIVVVGTAAILLRDRSRVVTAGQVDVAAGRAHEAGHELALLSGTAAELGLE